MFQIHIAKLLKYFGILPDKLWADMTDKEKMYLSLVVFLEFCIFIWALTRAVSCSNPDTRALHLLFAIYSPMFYLFFSYVVGGFCPPMFINV